MKKEKTKKKIKKNKRKKNNNKNKIYMVNQGFSQNFMNILVCLMICINILKHVRFLLWITTCVSSQTCLCFEFVMRYF